MMLGILRDSYYKKVLILAILLRILVMPFLFHPDIKVYNFQASFLKEGVLDIYEYLQKEKQNLPLKEEFVYFPLTYYFLGVYQWSVSPILGGDFQNWLENREPPKEGYPDFRYLFILKLPILFFDILCSLVIIKLFDENNRKKVFTFWLLNPFSIVVLYVFSNVDIIPVLFILLSLNYMKENRFLLSSIMLGIGAGFKVFPLIILPFLIFYQNRLLDKFRVGIIGLLSFTIIILPFLLNQSFRESTLVSGLTTRLLIANVNLGFGESLLIGLAAVFILVFIAYMKEKLSFKDVYIYSFLIYLIIFSFIHFHSQWLLWLLPGVVFIAANGGKLNKLSLAILLIGLLIPTLYEDKFMTVSLYSLINSNFNQLPTPFGVLTKIYDPYIALGILHTLFTSLCLVLTYKLMKEEKLI